jgi:hypothetical protein
MLSAHARHVTSVEAADVTAAEAADVAATETTHVAAATAVSPAAAAAATAGLCTRCKKATGKHGTCQNQHHSSSHDISFEMGHRALRCRRWGRLFVGSTKFAFNDRKWNARRGLEQSDACAGSTAED